MSLPDWSRARSLSLRSKQPWLTEARRRWHQPTAGYQPHTGLRRDLGNNPKPETGEQVVRTRGGRCDRADLPLRGQAPGGAWPLNPKHHTRHPKAESAHPTPGGAERQPRGRRSGARRQRRWQRPSRGGWPRRSARCRGRAPRPLRLRAPNPEFGIPTPLTLTLRP